MVKRLIELVHIMDVMLIIINKKINLYALVIIQNLKEMENMRWEVVKIILGQEKI